ncbi:hypothetical protein TG4357_02387 [Thalassovita gelatinovora]|uniref:Uncharacterized protein n=1 Tax=Thalassovita gelatinovora TaxID=53501 RepID=A0A0P1FDR1_THAGE|nr:hypothetical protein [Thalassovita gelatinovora]QIZ81498.1 hypothetical protein HFZ77_13925 [Thalassovita gelatinovora]CUH66352.1 hypothetical protein TG4357_02387 [Thalassovita gelatinovora]SEQ24387.1 hypothetical protein SAMN04488043_104118 [Thalassovita gelatinovora]
MPLADQNFSQLLMLIGRLNYIWTNTESLFIHLIAGLTGTDTEAALIIFLTLNTTRARVELVERLVKLERTDPELRLRILEATKMMMRQSALRNRYNHCIYSFDKDAGTARTILMRIADRKDTLKIGQTADIDDKAIEEIEETIKTLQSVNGTIWKIVQDYEFPT